MLQILTTKPSPAELEHVKRLCTDASLTCLQAQPLQVRLLTVPKGQLKDHQRCAGICSAPPFSFMPGRIRRARRMGLMRLTCTAHVGTVKLLNQQYW